MADKFVKIETELDLEMFSEWAVRFGYWDDPCREGIIAYPESLPILVKVITENNGFKRGLFCVSFDHIDSLDARGNRTHPYDWWKQKAVTSEEFLLDLMRQPKRISRL